jgi:hypothetical protein
VTETTMTFGELRDRLVQEALEENKTTVQTFTESVQFRQWAAGDVRGDSGLEWESRHIPNAQVVTVYPTALEAYKRFTRTVIGSGGIAVLFHDPVQLLLGFLDLTELLIDLRRQGKNLRSVEATTVYFAVKRTGREGMLRQDLVACVSESQYEDQDAGRRSFVPEEQVEPIIDELVSMSVCRVDGDRVSVADEYLS